VITHCFFVIKFSIVRGYPMENTIPQIVGHMLGGLGLFFIGVRLIGTNLRMMSGRPLRKKIAKVTGSSFLSAIMGFISGAITQSTSAVTFIMTGVISAGLVPMRRAMPLVLWSNTGNCMLVFLALVDFHIVVLYSLGLVGFLYYFDADKNKAWRPIVGSLLGIVLLFYGLDMMKSGAGPLKEYAWFTTFLAYADKSYILGLLAAGALSFIVQSAASVSAIAIALANTGLLNLDSALMIIYGTNIGPGISTWILGSKLHGAPKQITYFQVLFKFTALTIMVSLFYVENYTGIPLVEALLQKITSDFSQQLALGYLLFQIVGAVSISMFMDPIHRMLERFFPETEVDQLSKPQFLYDEALRQPTAALDLVEQEEIRALDRLPVYLDSLREEGKVVYSPLVLHTSTVALNQEILGYLEELINQKQHKALISQGLNLESRGELIIAMEESVFDLVSTIQKVDFSEQLKPFLDNVVESMHVLLVTIAHFARFKDYHDRELIMKMTEDRADLLKRIHRELYRAYPNLALIEQQGLQTISSRIERIVWKLRRFASIIPEARPSLAPPV